MKQVILSNIWLAAIVDGKLKCNKPETRHTEKQLVSSVPLWQVEVQQT
jgi:hypothetical protein